MSSVMVDSNVLLDILTDDPTWSDWAAEALAETAETARLVINPVIYAEISVHYSQIEALEDALPRGMLDREPLSYEAAFLAGKAFVAYRRRGGSRTSSLPDFLIGAHAAIAGYGLITRDSARYRTYFPSVDLITP